MANNVHYAVQNMALVDLQDKLDRAKSFERDSIKSKIEAIRVASQFDVIIARRDMMYARRQIFHELERSVIEKNENGVTCMYDGGNIILRLPKEAVYSGEKPGITFLEFEEEEYLEKAIKHYGLPFVEKSVERFLD
jgi:hypothetical protein|tara:strand:+ start:1050 stop:1457 length:408 start_codon:yes stop_codon:yes gene_type:complete